MLYVQLLLGTFMKCRIATGRCVHALPAPVTVDPLARLVGGTVGGQSAESESLVRKTNYPKKINICR